MPLFYQQYINDNSQLAIWKITEEEAFFTKAVTAKLAVSHPQKRLQHLAGRYLLKTLVPDFPVNKILLDGNRPFLENNTYYFSISHCADYAAAIISTVRAVGIDIELITAKIEILESKYLSVREQEIVRKSLSGIPTRKLLTALWSTKEAMFKWYAKGKVDFKKDMEICSLHTTENGIEIYTRFHKEMESALIADCRFFDDLCLVWIT